MFIRLYSYSVGEKAMGEISIGSLINPLYLVCYIFPRSGHIIVATDAIVNYFGIAK